MRRSGIGISGSIPGTTTNRFVEEVIEDGNDVVARVHIKARGQGSGVEADVRFFAQFKVRDGKVAYIYDHNDRAAALEAAGLSE
jgi:ketosteroid isomerase-like protein